LGLAQRRQTMHVDVRQAEDVVVVDLEGRLVAGPGEELLRDVMNELLAEGWKKILLNLSSVDRIDSAGVGELVAGTRLAMRFDSRVKVLQGGDRVRHVLHVSHVLPLLDTYDDEATALAAFAQSEPMNAREARGKTTAAED